MAPTVVVDVEHVERLGREFLAAAELMSRFSRRLAGSWDATSHGYGSLPESAAAAGHHDQVVQSALGYLKKIEQAYSLCATQLRLAARHYDALAEHNADLVTQVAAGLDRA